MNSSIEPIVYVKVYATFNTFVGLDPIFATAQAYQAVLWTQDADFKGKDNVRYVAKKPL